MHAATVDRSLYWTAGLAVLVTVLSLGPSIFFPGALMGLLMIRCAGWLWQDRRQIVQLSWPLWVGILGAALLASSVALLTKHSLRETKHLLMALLSMATVFVALRHTPSQITQRAGRIAITCVVFLLLLLVVMALGTTGDTLSLRYNPLIFKWTSGIHELANVLSSALIILVVFWRNRALSPLQGSAWSLMLGVLLVGMLIITNSRGAYVALPPALLYAIFPTRKSIWLLVALAWLGEMGAWLSVEMFNPSTTQFYGLAFNNATHERILLAQGTWQAIMNRPWLGYGLDSFKDLGSQLHIPLAQVMPHNIILEAMFGVGAVGALIWVVTMLITASRAARNQRLLPTQQVYQQIAVALAIYLSLRGLTELHLGFRYYLSWATILGFWLAAYHPTQRVIDYEADRLHDLLDQLDEPLPVAESSATHSSNRFKRF